MNTNMSDAEISLLKAARAYRHLCVYYRLGKKPSKTLFKHLENADKIIDSYAEEPTP